MNSPDYRAMARDLMKLCKKHGIKISATYEGHVSFGPSDGKMAKDFPFGSFKFSPTECSLGEKHDEGFFMIKKDSD